MNYIDSSVVLAAVLAEDRVPPDAFWQEDGITSRLLQASGDRSKVERERS